MSIEQQRVRLSSDEMARLCREYTMFDWSAQSKVAPVSVARAEGVYFYSPEGKRFLDLSSQLMCVNVGHGDTRIIDAIVEQARTMPYISPFMATEPRALLGQKLSELLPGDMDKIFFTLGGAEANENAIRIARAYTGRNKILARYRSYHGATAGAISLTGDPRRWPNEPGIPGVVHVLDFYHGTDRAIDDGPEAALKILEETIDLEGPKTIAAFILEPVTGTNGILIPPDGYLQGVRSLCDRYGILMIADEIMSGFGRTGEWFAVNHWGVVPDLMTMAKGLTSSYVPLGAVGLRAGIAAYFEDHVFYGGLTYNSHPLACAAAVATLAVYEEDDLIANARRMGVVVDRLSAELQRRHPTVGRHRNIGLFGVLELVRDRASMQPLAPFNSSSPEMAAIAAYMWENGVYVNQHWNTMIIAPPLCVTESQLEEAYEILDGALGVADQMVG